VVTERSAEPLPTLAPVTAPVRRPSTREPAPPREPRAITLGVAVATLAFWMIAVAKLLGNIGTQALHVHQAAFLVDHGSTPRMPRPL